MPDLPSAPLTPARTVTVYMRGNYPPFTREGVGSWERDQDGALHMRDVDGMVIDTVDAERWLRVEVVTSPLR